jgi:hypothetical protein
MTKVLFALVPCPQAEWEGEAYREFVLDLFHRQARGGFTERYALVNDAETADLAVVLEPVSFKTAAYRNVLRGMDLVRNYPGKILTINYDDAPLAFLPGIYSAMPAKRFEPRFTIAGGYLVDSPNQFVRQSRVSTDFVAEYLFTFRGALSSPVRHRMFRERLILAAGSWQSKLTAIDAWFNHSDQQKRDYVEEIRRSQFVLCPRGQGTVSFRLFEVMELGRVPVIIADEWVEPTGPRWPEFSIRVRESEVRSIPSILIDRESEFPAMAQKAREAWEEFFAPEVRLSWMLDQLIELRAQQAGHQTDYRTRWKSRRFNRGNVGSLLSRIQRRLGF